MLRSISLAGLLFATVSQALAATPLTLAQSQKSPYTLVGQLLFDSGRTSYVGSGVVIASKSLLTAGHNVYDPDTGWSTNVEFRVGKYGANNPVAHVPTHQYVLAGYQQNSDKYGGDDVRAFAYDTGGMTFANPLANGDSLPYLATSSYLQRHYTHVAVGYGAEGNHSGDVPLYVIPTRFTYRIYGNFYENYSIYIEGGMSGGPYLTVIGGKAYVHGIVVSSSYRPISGGFRLIDAATVSMINTYLR